jgi:hypothetical protein
MSPPSPFLEEQPDQIASQPRGDGGLSEAAALRPDRPNYATGMLLDAEDFRAEQLYHRSRLAEALFYLGGSGTLAGLRVEWQEPATTVAEGPEQDGEIEVQPGLALDRFGRLIEVRNPACLRLQPWLAGLTRPLLHGAPHNGLVADVFIRFVAAPRGYTPAYAAGPYDATDAITPARIRDSYRLELLHRTEVGQLEANLPQDRWADLGTIANLDERRLALQERILSGWKGGTDQWDTRGPVPLLEHVEGQDPTALFLARLIIPASMDADLRLTRTGDVSVRNDLRQFVYSTAALAAWSGLRPNPA